jgi:ABC-type glutathione transport system ATPase component
MSNAGPVVELRDVSVRLGGSKGWLRRTVPPTHAVSHVSLSLRRGEVLALVGESGSGKTTLARTMLGLQRETSGDILLDGRPVSDVPPQQARRMRPAIQYVHQDAAAALDPWWSIGRTLQEGLAIKGLRDASKRRQRVDAMLEAVGLDAAAARRYPHEFSGGQLRRVALARILLLEPRVLILDEPTSGLDMSVQAIVLNLLLELRKRLSLTYDIAGRRAAIGSARCARGRAARRAGGSVGGRGRERAGVRARHGSSGVLTQISLVFGFNLTSGMAYHASEQNCCAGRNSPVVRS